MSKYQKIRGGGGGGGDGGRERAKVRCCPSTCICRQLYDRNTVLKLTIFNGTVQNSDAALLAINGQRDRY